MVRLTDLWKLSTLCGVLAMLVLVTGCPPGTPCEDDAICDDGLFCNGLEFCDLDTMTCAAGADPCEGLLGCDEDGDYCIECDAETPCVDDEDLCTVDDCVDGLCPYTPVDCGDNVCDPNTGECIGCVDDADCDDGLFCNGAEFCEDSECVDGMAPCDPVTEVCDEDTGTCVVIDLCDGVVCDNGDFCDGEETCDPDTGLCVDGTDPCEGAVDCDEDTDECIWCTVAADCDDADLCTDDACDAGVCVNTPVDCDNGLFCDGVETCDELTGLCVDGDDPCDPLIEGCDDVLNVCTDLIVCTVDADCPDDGLFCTAAWVCVAGFCEVGDDPCNADEICVEATDSCTAPAGQTFTLTTSTDSGPDFAGGSGDDTYDGLLFLSGGNFFQTLNNADVLDGGDGTDTLSAQFNPAAATTVTPSMANIEVFNFEVTTGNAQTVSMGNAGSQTTINFNNSQTDGGDLLITNVANKLTNLGMTNVTEDFTVTVAATALTGTTDECTLALNGVTLGGGEPTITLQPSGAIAASGYETLNIVSQGSVVNSIQAIADGVGNSLTTFVVTGSAALDMNAAAVPTTITTFDASGATGDVDVLVPGDGAAGTAIIVNGGSGSDELDCTDTADENFTLAGGAGDDKITFNANYDSASPFTDTIDGGDGTDILVVVSADAVATTVQSAVSNIETLQVSNALAGNLDAGQYWGAITKVTLDAGIDGTARTITLPNAGTLDLNADAGAATHVLQVSGTGTSDAVTLDLASGVDFPNPLTVTGIEELTIAGPAVAGVKNDFGNTVTMTASAGGSTKIIITGANEVEFSAAITAGIIDGGACTGVIDIQANMAGACSILGGTAADTLTGSNSNDVINGGAGADIIDGQDGDDTLTGGTGADTFYTVDGDQSTTPSSSIYTTITDFEIDSDIIDDTAAALSIATGTTNFGVATASINSEGFCTFNSADDTLQERIVAAEDGIVENGAAAAGQFCLFEHGGHTYLFISEGTDALDVGDVLIQLNGVTGLSDTTISGGNLTIK